MCARDMRPAQAMVEFALCLPVLALLTLGTMGLAWTCWQQASVEHSLATLATELPGGWEAREPAELVASLVAGGSGGTLEADRVSVASPSVRVDSTSDTRTSGDAFLTEERKYVRVSADVSYEVDNPLWPALSTTVRRHVERTYLAATRTEVG